MMADSVGFTADKSPRKGSERGFTNYIQQQECAIMPVSSTTTGPKAGTTTATVVSADGTVIGYESIGTGPPVLLVHGATGTRRRWSSVRAALAQHYTVHAMARRGGGLSSVEAGPYSLRREAEDVSAVAQAVGGDVY